MIECPFFCTETDVQRTIQGLGIDLEKAIQSGVVTDSGTEPEYNGIEDPKSIRCRVQSVFDAMEQRNAVLNRASVSSDAPDDNDLPS